MLGNLLQLGKVTSSRLFLGALRAGLLQVCHGLGPGCWPGAQNSTVEKQIADRSAGINDE